jgi:hypothetical protein
MNRSLLFRHRTTLGTLCLLAGLTAAPVQAADKSQTAPPVKAATTSQNTIAAGAVEDSLKACLARIPKEATAGQRMIAEQGCQRDETERKPFQVSGSY